MEIREFVSVHECIVEPYASIDSIESRLLSFGYVVVMEGDRFLGLVSARDIVEKGHNLAIDCIVPRPSLAPDEKIDAVVRRMLDSGESIFPVQNGQGRYIGSVELARILIRLWEIAHLDIQIQWHDSPGSREVEAQKELFSMELFHNTRNPIQAILSASEMLGNTSEEMEKQALLNAIKSNALALNTLITRLFEEYFEHGKASGLSLH